MRKSSNSSVDSAKTGSAYREITADLREQSLQRHERRLADVSDLQDALRLKLLRGLALGLLLLVGGGLLLKKTQPRSAKTR